MMSLKLTDEQAAAVTAFKAGGDLTVQAGAGTGKTFTLVEMAKASPNEQMVYIAFNRAIVDEARRKMPKNVTCSTAHSLAMRAVGRRYAHRLPGRGSRRMRGDQIAKILGIDPFMVGSGEFSRRLSPGWLAGQVMRGIERFCQTADKEPGAFHVPWADGLGPSETDSAAKAANRELGKYLAPFLQAAWKDIQDEHGTLPFSHAHYLKMYQGTDPSLRADRLLVDEAQDLNPCMDAIVNSQWDMGRVWVGDSNQQIYGWNGAVDAMNRPGVPSVMLSQSFRFGQAVADAANLLLARLPTEMVLSGTPSIRSERRACPDAGTVLCRTNGGAIHEFMDAVEAGKRPALVGGAQEIIRFARGAQDLIERGWTSYGDLSCFGSWGEVLTYVEDDPQGSDLAMLAGIIGKFGAVEIIDLLDHQPKEDAADLVISTAHKSKGREWPEVRFSTDFPPREKSSSSGSSAAKAEPEVSSEDIRLLYVAATRAERVLDAESHPWLTTEGQ